MRQVMFFKTGGSASLYRKDIPSNRIAPSEGQDGWGFLSIDHKVSSGHLQGNTNLYLSWGTPEAPLREVDRTRWLVPRMSSGSPLPLTVGSPTGIFLRKPKRKWWPAQLRCCSNLRDDINFTWGTNWAISFRICSCYTVVECDAGVGGAGEVRHADPIQPGCQPSGRGYKHGPSRGMSVLALIEDLLENGFTPPGTDGR